MDSSSVSYDGVYVRRCSRTILSILWCCGLIFGFTCFALNQMSCKLFMEQIRRQSLSLLNFLVPTLLWLFFTVIAAVLSVPKLLFLFSFARGFCIGFVLRFFALTAECYATDYICVYLIALLINTCSLLWLWYRHISSFRISFFQDVVSCFICHIFVYLLTVYFLCYSF